MSFLPDWWQREPVRFGAAVVIFVNSMIALAVSFDWLPIAADQLALLYLVVLNGAVLIFGEAVRGLVSPSGTEPAVEDDE
jgi:hypothetical protein